MMYIGVFCCMCVYINVVKGFQSFTRCALVSRGSATKDIALWRDLDNKNTAPVVPTKIYKNKGLVFEIDSVLC